MSYARQVFSNTVVQIAAKVIIALLSVVTIKMITNYLGQTQYGEYTYIYEYLGLFAILADMGLYTIGVKEMSSGKQTLAKVLSNILGMRIFLATGSMLLALLYAYVFGWYQDHLFFGMCITAGALFFAFMTGTLTTVLQVQMKMQRAAGPLVIGKIISTGYLAYSILHEFSFEHLLLAGLIGNIFVFALTYYYAAQESVIRVEFDKEYWMHIVRTALPYGLALILSTIYFRIDSIMLFEMRGADEVGIYGVPMRILEIVNIIPIIFLNTVLPAMTQFAQQENKEKLSSMMQKSWDILVFLSFPLAAGSIALALPLILFVSSPEFAPSVDPMRILMFAMIFSFLNSVFAFILVALGRQAKMLYVNGVVVIFNVVANYFAITHYGYMGAAVTSVLSEFFVLAANAAIVYYYFPFVFSWLRTAKIFISSVCMWLLVYILYQGFLYGSGLLIELLWSIIVGALVYAIMVYALRIYRVSDVTRLMKSDW